MIQIGLTNEAKNKAHSFFYSFILRNVIIFSVINSFSFDEGFCFVTLTFQRPVPWETEKVGLFGFVVLEDSSTLNFCLISLDSFYGLPVEAFQQSPRYCSVLEVCSEC